MSPVTIGAELAAVAGDAGRALGSQAWDGVSAMVRRAFLRCSAAEDGAAVQPGGDAELVAMAQAHGIGQQAMVLAAVLVAQADMDSGFSEALQSWWDQGRQVKIGGGVTSTISGNTQYASVLQTRNFTGLIFGTLVRVPAPPVGLVRADGRS